MPKGPPPAASRLTATGNSGIPIFLRSIFAVLQRFRPNSPGVRFVLDNPRRITSSFFDSKQTAALFLIVSFNLLIQYIFFLATSLNKPEIIDSAPYNQLLNMGWFQSVSTRAAGMNVFDLRALSKANAVIYALMMYIGSAPLVSLMQATEQTVVAKFVDGQVVMVYQARGRGRAARFVSAPTAFLTGRRCCCGRGTPQEEEEKKDQGKQFKAYLSSHIRWLCVAFLAIATAEEKARRHPGQDPQPAQPWALCPTPRCSPVRWAGAVHDAAGESL